MNDIQAYIDLTKLVLAKNKKTEQDEEKKANKNEKKTKIEDDEEEEDEDESNENEKYEKFGKNKDTNDNGKEEKEKKDFSALHSDQIITIDGSILSNKMLDKMMVVAAEIIFDIRTAIFDQLGG